MHGSGEVSNGFVATLEATRSVGFGPPGDQRLTTALSWVESEPEPLRWLRLAEAIGAAPAGLHTEFPLTAAERVSAAALIGPPDGRPVVGLHIGASDPSRRWPAESFARLGARLAEQRQARIVLTGSDQERSLTAAVRRAMKTPAIDLAGMTELGEFAAVISALDLLVTNDTGASHVAAAMRTPSVVLFGPSRPDRWAPLDRRRHQVIDAASYPGAPADGAAALQRSRRRRRSRRVPSVPCNHHRPSTNGSKTRSASRGPVERPRSGTSMAAISTRWHASITTGCSR